MRKIENDLEEEKENCHGYLHQDLRALFDFLHYLRHDFGEQLLLDRDVGISNNEDINTLNNELQYVEEKYFELFDGAD